MYYILRSVQLSRSSASFFVIRAWLIFRGLSVNWDRLGPIAVSHRLATCDMTWHDTILLSTIVYYCLLLSTIVYYLLLSTVYYCLLLSTIYYCLLSTIVYCLLVASGFSSCCWPCLASNGDSGRQFWLAFCPRLPNLRPSVRQTGPPPHGPC